MKYLLLLLFFACTKKDYSSERDKEIAKEAITKKLTVDSLLWEIQGLRFDYPVKLSIEPTVDSIAVNSWQTVNWKELTTYTLYADSVPSRETVLTVTGHTDSPANPKVRTLRVNPGEGKRKAIYLVRKGVEVFTFTRL